MGLERNHREFIAKQPMFFVATAPLNPTGHVNVSPKGYDSFRVFSATEVGYLDLTGSGNETASHVLENGRITIMFMAVDGPPQVLRIYGKGRAVLPQSEEWHGLSQAFPTYPGIRQIIMVDVYEVSTSCGYGVPLLSYQDDRDTLARWAVNKGDEGLQVYRRDHNRRSLDDLPTS